MKKYFYLMIILILFNSCSLDNKSSDNYFSTDLPQTWKLESLATGYANELLEDENLPFQEEYILYEDNTFIKRRVQGESIFEVHGTFEFQLKSDIFYLQLFYLEENDLIINCSKNIQETLIYSYEDKSLQTTSELCDVGIFIYKIV